MFTEKPSSAVMAWPAFFLFILAGSVIQPSMAQTACPGGVAAGSRMCGPDGGSQNVRIVRHEGYGAYADSMSARISYASTGGRTQMAWMV